jgi:hypothetical protein
MANLTATVLRQKVDLTKYMEAHDFTFDNCYDSQADNQQVSKTQP